MSKYTKEDLDLLKATAKKLTDLIKAAELVPTLTDQMCALMHDEIVEADKAISHRQLVRYGASILAVKPKITIEVDE